MKHFLSTLIFLASFHLSVFSQDKLLHVGVIEMPPYTSAQYLQDYGLFTEIVNAACSEVGITPLYDLIPAKRAAMTVKAGRLFGAFPFTKSLDEAKEFYFSDSVLFLKGTFFYHKKHFKGNRQAKNLESIKSLQLGGVLGSFYQEELGQKGFILHNVPSEKLLLGMMEKQRIDLAPMDFTSGWNFIREYYPDHVMDFDTLPFTFAAESLHVMVSKKYPQSKELLKSFNTGLQTIKQNGKLNAIFTKYNVSRAQYSQRTGANKKICLALDGELGDRGFNDMQYNGLLEAKNRFNIDIAFRIPPDDRESNTLIKLIDNLIAEEKCDMVISAGFPMLHPVLEATGKYPQTIFAHIDSGSLDKIPSNLITANFAQAEGSFAVGFPASRLSVRKKVGYIGGVNIPVLKTFEKGFRAGVKYGAPEMKVVAKYISELPDYSGFSNPQKAKDMAHQMYEEDTSSMPWQVRVGWE